MVYQLCNKTFAILLKVLLTVVVLVVRIYVKLTKGKCHSKARLDGCTALVTGANNGNYLVDSYEKITPRGPCLAFFLFFPPLSVNTSPHIG